MTSDAGRLDFFKCAEMKRKVSQSADAEFFLSHAQAGSYRFVRRISTDKRASSDQPIARGKPTYRY
jgi:hypothetical protein